MIIELGRVPELVNVSISSADRTAIQGGGTDKSITLPTDSMGFLIYSRTANVSLFWAVESGQFASAATDPKYRTVGTNTVGGVTGIRTRKDTKIYLFASAATTIECEVYTRY